MLNRILIFIFISAGLLEAASIKELEERINMLEVENSRLRHELAMEDEASKLLGEKLLKAYEEKVVLENGLKDRDGKIESLEKEMADVRKLMEKEAASNRKEIAALRKEIDRLKIKGGSPADKRDSLSAYVERLEKEKMEIAAKLAGREKDMEAALATIDKLEKKILAITETARLHKPPQTSASDKDMIEEAAKSEVHAPAPGRGRILTISKEHNFVIIECADISGIEAGDAFSVFRGENNIGEIEVTKIRGKYLLGAIRNIMPGEEIREGDTVRQ